MSSARYAFNKSLTAVLCCVLFAAAAWGQSAPASIPAIKPAISPATGPTTAAAEEVTITGKVVDAEGKPVEGADVQVHFMKGFRNDLSALAGKGLSKADGTFDIPVVVTREMLYGTIIAKKAGFAIGWGDYYGPNALGVERSTRPSIITLGKPSILEGKVVDEAGIPIHSADIKAMLIVPDSNRAIFLDPFSDLHAVSDAQGLFRIEDVPADCVAEFMVSAAGKARIRTHTYEGGRPKLGQFRPGQKDIKITLPPECRLMGMIVGKATGQPIPALLLMASPKTWAGIRPTCNSDEEGRFVFDHLLGGQYTITLQTSPYEVSEWVFEPLTADAVATATTAPAASQPTAIKIEASKGGIAEIIVVEAAKGGLIARASISLNRTNMPLVNVYASAVTDQAGRARLRLLPGDWAISYAQASGYQGIRGDPSGSSSDPSRIAVKVVEGQTSQTKIELKPLPTYSGIVKDSSGQVVEGATVHVFGDYSAAACKTDKDGRFTVSAGQSSGGPPGEQPRAPSIIVRHVQRNLAAIVEVDDSARQVDATLMPASTLCGTVTGEDGKPIANATISFSVVIGNTGSSLEPSSPIRTDAQGKFEILAIPTDQKYYLYANADGYGQFHLQPGKLEIMPGRVEMPPIVLPTADQSVSGIVVDAEDKAVAGTQVNISGNNQPYRNAVTDKDGKFEITKVVAGPLQLNAWLNDPATGDNKYANAKANGGDKDIKLVLREQSGGRMAGSAEARRSLLNKPLPKLEEFGLKANGKLAPGKPILICFFDMENRSSRRAVLALAAKAAELDSKGMVVVLIHTGSGDEQAVKSWVQQNKVGFPIGVAGSDDANRRSAQAKWGADALPWLILADSKHQVQAEGFAVEQLDQILTKANEVPQVK